jgi:hypothetical protein
MGLIPPTIHGKIELFESKVAPWTAAATAIGTTSAAVTAMAGKAAAARAKLAAQIAAQAAAEAATADLHMAVRDLVRAGSDIVKQVRAKAATDGRSVNVLAQIPPARAAVPDPRPGHAGRLHGRAQPGRVAQAPVEVRQSRRVERDDLPSLPPHRRVRAVRDDRRQRHQDVRRRDRPGRRGERDLPGRRRPLDREWHGRPVHGQPRRERQRGGAGERPAGPQACGVRNGVKFE